MTKRQRIMAAMSGGTEAPKNARRLQIAKAIGTPSAFKPPKGIRNLPSMGRTAPTRNASLVNPSGVGRQLSNRVASGNISAGQAQKTSNERQLLQKAFGSDWRTQVFGKGGAKGLATSAPFGRAAVRTKRAQALQRAKRKLY